jgi:hypothetical protein
MKHLIFVVSALIALAMGTFSRTSYAQCQGGGEEGNGVVSRDFSAGSRWEMWVRRTPCEGLVLRDVTLPRVCAVSVQCSANNPSCEDSSEPRVPSVELRDGGRCLLE